MGKEETRQTFEEITEWKKLQEKQPELDDNIEFGDGEGRRAVRLGWEVLQSDYGDSERGTGVIVFETSKKNFLVEIWEDSKLVRAFSPMNDLEAYAQVCEERGWTLELF